MNRKAIPFLICGLLFVSGCGASITRAQVEQYKSKGKVVAIVAPARLTLHSVVGIGGGEDKLSEVYGGVAPWRGDGFIAVGYSGQRPFMYPLGIDFREIALRKLTGSASKQLGLALSGDLKSKVFERLASNTYWEFSSASLVDFASGRGLSKEDWKEISNDGVSAAVVVAIVSEGIFAQGGDAYSVCGRILLFVIDTSTGEVVHVSGQLSGFHRKPIAIAEVAPFFPAISNAATIFGIADEVKAYRAAVTRDPAHTERLKVVFEESIGAALDEELAKMAK